MKTLIIFYSRTGTTRKMAAELAAKLNAAQEEIIDEDKRAGALGYLKSGREAMQKKLAVIKPLKADLADYGLVIIGTPVWAFTISSPVRAFLIAAAGKIKRAAFFATQGGNGAEKTIEEMAELIGLKPSAALVATTKEVVSNNYHYQEKINQFIKELGY